MLKQLLTDDRVKEVQKIRMQRFFMALVTYGIVVGATVLVTRLGLGEFSSRQWLAYIGTAVFINVVLFVVFYTGANLKLPEPSLTREQIILSGLWGMIALYSLPEARPIILMFFLPPFSFGMLRLKQKPYLKVVGWVMGIYAGLLVYEYLQTRPGFRVEHEVFLFLIYSIVLVWFAFFGGMVSEIRYRLKSRNRDLQKASDRIRDEMEERKRAEVEKDQLIDDLQEALAQIETLSGLLPICASCKKIRDDKGSWKQIESYIKEHSNAEFSHSICPECARKLYPKYDLEKRS